MCVRACRHWNRACDHCTSQSPKSAGTGLLGIPRLRPGVGVAFKVGGGGGGSPSWACQLKALLGPKYFGLADGSRQEWIKAAGERDSMDFAMSSMCSRELWIQIGCCAGDTGTERGMVGVVESVEIGKGGKGGCSWSWGRVISRVQARMVAGR